MTSDTIIIALIAAIPGTLAALSSRRNASRIQEIHVLMNSRLTELLKSVRGEASAEGREIGRAESKGDAKLTP